MSTTSMPEDMPRDIADMDKNHQHRSPITWNKEVVEHNIHPLLFFNEQNNQIYQISSRKVLVEYNLYYLRKVTPEFVAELANQPKSLRPTKLNVKSRKFTAPHLRITPIEKASTYRVPIPRADTSAYKDAYNDTSHEYKIWGVAEQEMINPEQLDWRDRRRFTYFRPSEAYTKNIVTKPTPTKRFSILSSIISFIKSI